jgi:hypothetical protein
MRRDDVVRVPSRAILLPKGLLSVVCSHPAVSGHRVIR